MVTPQTQILRQSAKSKPGAQEVNATSPDKEVARLDPDVLAAAAWLFHIPRNRNRVPPTQPWLMLTISPCFEAADGLCGSENHHFVLCFIAKDYSEDMIVR
ncbi:MAG: hypothetical protein VR78_14350 [Hoeflea sp. BRH_c9]|nr:MAG: hypothetical protein VR78_14350 [Hoeflea sp. BRH_c9]